MATSNDIMKPAFFAIGASSDINPASPEMLEVAFKRFIVMMQKFEVDGMKQVLGTDFTDNPPASASDEINNSVGSDLALECVFAVWVAPLFRIEPSPTVRGSADSAMQTLRTIAFAPEAPEWPETLPVGAGNTRGPWNRVFFPVPLYTQAQQGDEEEIVTP
jgi:hypothetical protein